MVSDKIRQMILEKFGSPLKYPQQCEALALAISEATGETVGTTTLKRMLGVVRGVATSRRSSLDIIARFLGYADYDMLSMDVGMDCGISDFRPVESIDSADLEIGERIRISYDPGRMLELSFLGDNKYVVDESVGSKLRKGDRLLIAGFYRGFELLVSDVYRDGMHLGSYQGAKQGGLTDIEIID